MTKKMKNNDAIVTSTNQVLLAVGAHMPAKTEIPVAGERMSTADIKAGLKAHLDARADVVVKEGEYKQSLATRLAAQAKAEAIVGALEPWVLNTYGPTSAEAHAFGFSARKVTKPDAATTAKAVVLRQATRLARGTVGPKAKLKIKGTLPAVAAPPPAPVQAAPAPVVTAPVAAAPVVAPVVADPRRRSRRHRWSRRR